MFKYNHAKVTFFLVDKLIFRCLVPMFDSKYPISSMCPVTMVFIPRLLTIHSLFPTMCLLSGLHCWRAHLPWLFSNNPWPLQRETGKIDFLFLYGDDTSMQGWSGSHWKWRPPPLLILEPNEWTERECEQQNLVSSNLFVQMRSIVVWIDFIYLFI